MSEKNGPSAVQQMRGDLAPKLVTLTEDVLFGASGSVLSWRRGSAA